MLARQSDNLATDTGRSQAYSTLFKRSPLRRRSPKHAGSFELRGREGRGVHRRVVASGLRPARWPWRSLLGWQRDRPLTHETLGPRDDGVTAGNVPLRCLLVEAASTVGALDAVV